MKKHYLIIIILTAFFFVTPLMVNASNQDFYIESVYDSYSRNKVEANLVRTTNKINFYIEDHWWQGLSSNQRLSVMNRLYNLSTDFEYTIHPRMTSFFGPAPQHPVDDSNKLTVLFHRMTSNAGGYFNSGDQYSKYQYPRSNERNMVYISTSFIDNPLLRGFLAHEYMHLITFNAKEKTHNVQEEIWLNEARAEYMPTFFNYNSLQENSVLKRKDTFIRDPENSITEWLNRGQDYGSINMFVHYLVDHYGEKILADSLKSNKIGIASINEALKKNNHQKDFSEIFTDWTIAVLVNDCSLGDKYCYKTKDLQDLKITPLTNYLPSSRGSSFSLRRGVKDWSGNWYRFVGGVGDLTFNFQAEGGAKFKVPYVLCDLDDKCEVHYLDLVNNKAVVKIESFDENYSSLTIIPSAQNKISGFNGSQNPVYFSWSIETTTRKDNQTLIESLLKQIEELSKEIIRLQALINSQKSNVSCTILVDLGFNSRGDDVRCLQEILKSDGVYPEGLITGNFLSLTRQAVINFQEKYAAEILHPLGLTQGTGYVGARTREKLNQVSR